MIAADQQAEVQQAYDQSFVGAFNRIMWISAILALISSLAAFFLIDNKVVMEE